MAGDAPKRKRTIAERRFAERASELEKLGLRERFERIYSTNLWSDAETRSGVGSTLDSTRVVRAELPAALRQLGTRVVLDVPCGDFKWMEHVDLSGIEYIGGDIVPSIIEENRRLHARESRRFVDLDLTRDALPDADVLLCRDCLVHLSYANIQAVASDCSSSAPAGRCERSKAPMLSRPRKPPANTLLPSASFRLTHHVKLSNSLCSMRSRKSKSLAPSISNTCSAAQACTGGLTSLKVHSYAGN